MLLFKNRPFMTYYDGDGAGATATATTTGADPGAGTPATGTPAAQTTITPDLPKTFTQKQVDDIVANRVKNLRAESQKALTELQKLQQNQSLTQEERDTLAAQVEALQSQLMTKQQLAEQEAKKNQQKYESELKIQKEEAIRWRERYTSSTITQALTSAAAENEAVVPEQIVDLLKGNTRLVEATDEAGKPTGQLVPMIKLNGTDKEGKPIVLDLPVAEAVKQMKEMPKFGNLFKSGAVGGIGGTTTPGASAGTVDFEKMSPAEWIAWRKKNPQALENL